MPRLDKLDRKLLLSLIFIFLVAVVYLYLGSLLLSAGPATRVIQNDPWALVLAAWDLAVFISAREYLRAWESQVKLKGGQLF